MVNKKGLLGMETGFVFSECSYLTILKNKIGEKWTKIRELTSSLHHLNSSRK